MYNPCALNLIRVASVPLVDNWESEQTFYVPQITGKTILNCAVLGENVTRQDSCNAALHCDSFRSSGGLAILAAVHRPHFSMLAKFAPKVAACGKAK